MSREEIEKEMFIALVINYYVDRLENIEKVRGIERILGHLDVTTIMKIMDDLDIDYVRCVEES